MHSPEVMVHVKQRNHRDVVIQLLVVVLFEFPTALSHLTSVCGLASVREWAGCDSNRCLAAGLFRHGFGWLGLC
jgi:hypothetical protein